MTLYQVWRPATPPPGEEQPRPPWRFRWEGWLGLSLGGDPGLRVGEDGLYPGAAITVPDGCSPPGALVLQWSEAPERWHVWRVGREEWQLERDNPRWAVDPAMLDDARRIFRVAPSHAEEHVHAAARHAGYMWTSDGDGLERWRAPRPHRVTLLLDPAGPTWVGILPESERGR